MLPPRGGLTQEQVVSDNGDGDTQEPVAGENDGESDEQTVETTGNGQATGDGQQAGDDESVETTVNDEQPGDDESGSSDAAQSNSGNADADADANSQLGENNIMAVDLGSNDETYNEKADYREVTTGISVGIYKDSNYSQPVESTDSFTTDTTLYGKLNIEFSDAQKPTLSQPNIKYTFPKNVSFTNKDTQTLYDGNNKIAGTWYIAGGVAYLHYNEDWLRANANSITAHVSFDFTMAGNSQGDGKSVTVNFPGTATPVTIKTKDGTVDVSKFGADPSKTWEKPSFDATDNSYTWTIKVSPKTYATELMIIDEIGSNLSFVDNSFKLVDKTGATVSGNLGVSYSNTKGQATISLGNLSAGDYYIQYKTQVKQSALDALKDNEDLSNINNTIKWSWGTTPQQNGGPTSVDPQSVKYSMASKSASGTNDDITWTVTLNSGSLKADMSNYAFLDTLDDGQTFKSGTSYEVKDASGSTVVSGTVDPSSKTLSFNLPADAGKQQYTVTYRTQMTDTSSLDAVTNKVVVTPPDDSNYPSGEATGTYQPADKGTYITKSLTKVIDSASYDGVAEWKSQILFSDMSANTSAESIVFADHFTSLPSNVTVKLAGDVTVAIDGGETLEAGTDYVLTDKGEQGQWNDIFQITFKATEKVKALIGKEGAKVNVTYKTQTSKVNDAYPAGTYTNESTVKTDKKSAVSANASYEIESSTMPAVSKKSSTSTWDATYDWGDGEKGAWITEWEAHVNCDEPTTWTHQAASDLKGADVKLTDTLPEGMAYVAKSGQYTLVGDSGFNSLWNQTVEPTVTGNQAVFTVKTSTVAKNSGTEANPVYSWKGYVKFTYKTAVKASFFEAGESKEFTNSAQADAGTKTFPAGTAKTTITNQVLDKTAKRAADNSHVTFTIKVNPNALTIGSTGSLELEDTMNSGASFTSGSLHVKDANTGDEVTEGVSYKLSNGTAADGSSTTVLTLTVPDSRALTVTYDVSPQGVLGDNVYISNDVSMMGFASASKNYGQYWQVAKSNAGTEGTSYGLTITKTDDSGNKALEGAQFALYVVDLDKSTENDIQKSLVTGVGENPKTTDANGTVTFGTSDAPLDANKLYCYVETKAPSGYKISNTEPSYVMFCGTTDQDKKDFAAALAKAKTLGITPTIGTSVNVYDSLADGSFKIHVNKGVSGSYKDDSAPTFTFTATATGDNAELAPELSDVTITGAGEADFEGTLTKDMIGQTFTYDVKETVPAEADRPAGWTYDGKTVTAAVTVVEKDEKISAEVTYSKDGEITTAATFTNTYASSGEATISVYKTVNGGTTAKPGEKFTFDLYKADEDGNAEGEALGTVETEAGQVASFSNVKFTEAGTYRYVVKETGHNDKGWTAASDVKATVNVTDNGKGGLSANVSYSNTAEGAAGFDDTYEATGSATVSVKKTVNQGALTPDQEFTFGLFATDENGNKTGDALSTVTAKAGEAAKSFSALDYTFDKVGTYTYVISETSDLGAGWTKAADQKVTVTVEDNNDGTLKTTVTYEGDQKDAATFDNTYSSSVSAKLGVTKTVNGKDDIRDGEEFTFELQDSKGNKLADATVDSQHHTASFGAQTYDKAGTYEYTVQETSKLGEGWTNASDQKVYVTVEADKNGDLSVTGVTYGDKKETITAGATGEYDLVVNNTYATSANANLSVNKKVVGGTDATKDESFEFSLYEAEGYTVDEQGNVTAGTQIGESVFVKADGTAGFKALTYGLDDAGKTFSYVIHEVGHRTDGWTAAADVNVTVEVAQAADRSISTNVTYSNANADKTAALFTNTYASSGEATISVYKTVNGGTTAKPGEKFTFDLYKADEDGNAEGEALGTVETEAGQVASFSNVKFTEAGTYRYVVKETGHNDKGWTAASDVKATVNVTDNGKGGLSANVSYSNTAEGAAGFDDTYEATGSATIKVEKTVNGGTEAAEGEEFTFELYKADEDGKATGDVIDTVSVKAGATASFSADKLGYTFADAGKTYKYVVHETGHNADGWFAASDVVATVALTDNGDGTLDAQVSYSNGTNAALFDNVKSTATAQLKVYKTVNGGDIAEGEKFTFTLLDKDNKQVGDEKTCDVDNQVATLDALTFDKPGTYTYTIHETTVLTDGWTNDEDMTVTVTVVRDEETKTLKVESVDYGERAYEKDGQVMAHFDDKYSTGVDAGIKVSKTVNGGTDAVEGEWFEFELVGEDGKTVVSTAKAQAGQTVAFEGVKYTTADAGKEFKYTVHEVGHNDKGWTADSDVDVTVKVVKNADLTLSTEVTYGRGTNAAEFTNTYATAGTATVQVYKTVNGGTTAKPGERFTFELKDADGKTVDAVETEAGQVASFGALELTRPGTWTYTVHETGHDGNGWTAASDVTATVTAADNGDGTLTAAVEYSNAAEGAAGFDDTYEATGSATIKVEKTVNGGTEAAEGEEFTFDLYEGDKATGEPVDTVGVKAGATASFSALGYTFADAGKEFTYTVHETGHNTDGWVADSDVTAVVKVADNGDGTLKAEVTYSRGTNAAAFDDKYDTAATATIQVTKTVNGGTEAVAGEWFEFELLDKEGNEVEGAQAVKTQAGGTASFSALSYSLADAGKTFEYTVHEVGHNDKGWTADSDVDVTVKVVKNADLTLSTEVTYGRGTNAAEFTNTYATAGTATVQVYKTVNGGTTAKPGERFTFELKDADGKTVDAVETEAGQVASFGALELTRPGTWTYTVHETGHDGNGWTAASDVTATVTAADNGDGTLTAAVEYSNAAEGAAGFDDTYEAVGELEVKVSKTVNGGKYADDHEFEFGLFETDEFGVKTGDPISTVKVKAGQTAVLNGVFYDLDNAGETITYVVSELGELGVGWTKAADQTVAVKVADNNDGTLSVDVTYEGGASAAAFDNKYEQPTTPEQPQQAEEKKRAAAPFTGDTANATFALVGAAGLALVAASLRRRRNDA